MGNLVAVREREIKKIVRIRRNKGKTTHEFIPVIRNQIRVWMVMDEHRDQTEMRSDANGDHICERSK